jgi:hypothetical protein
VVRVKRVRCSMMPALARASITLSRILCPVPADPSTSDAVPYRSI